MSTSVRKQIVDGIVASLAAIKIGEPASNPYLLEWSEVTTKELSDNMVRGRRAMCGVYPTNEQKASPTYPLRDVMLRIAIEMHVTRDTEEGPEALIETALQETERRLMEDETVGGKAISLQIVESTTDLNGYFSNVASATMEIDVKYRHHRADPAQQS